jgi:hypothetical protein
VHLAMPVFRQQHSVDGVAKQIGLDPDEFGVGFRFQKTFR